MLASTTFLGLVALLAPTRTTVPYLALPSHFISCGLMFCCGWLFNRFVNKIRFFVEPTHYFMPIAALILTQRLWGLHDFKWAIAQLAAFCALISVISAFQGNNRHQNTFNAAFFASVSAFLFPGFLLWLPLVFVGLVLSSAINFRSLALFLVAIVVVAYMAFSIAWLTDNVGTLTNYCRHYFDRQGFGFESLYLTDSLSLGSAAIIGSLVVLGILFVPIGLRSILAQYRGEHRLMLLLFALGIGLSLVFQQASLLQRFESLTVFAVFYGGYFVNSFPQRQLADSLLLASVATSLFAWAA